MRQLNHKVPKLNNLYKIMLHPIFLVIVFSTLLEESLADRLVATKIGRCIRKKAYGIIRMRKYECNAMGGGWNGNPGYSSWLPCHLDWCQIPTSGKVATANVWAVCEYDKQAPASGRTYGIVVMKRFECDRMNGKYNGNPTNNRWIECHLYWCSFPGDNKANIEGIVPATVGQCSGPKIAYGIIRMIHRECAVLNGGWNGNPGAYDWIDCHLDWCVTINCEPRDEWRDVQICSNLASSASSTCKVTYTVGTTNTKSTSSTHGGSVSVTVEQSVGITLEEIFSASSKVGITTGFSWSKTSSSSASFSKSTTQSIVINVPAKSAVKLQQVVGYCGHYRVDTVHYRVVDI